jgi:glycosyltransferase involved in cell wall biosynthesis
VFLDGVKVPGVRRVLRHDYPLTPGLWRALREAKPDCVVVSGWSTFAAQAAIGWCRTRRVPYVLLVESHDAGPKSGWRRRVKQTVVPTVVKGAASILVTGSLARESMLALGAPPDRIRVFANTIDVTRFGEQADRLRADRPRLRAAIGLEPDDTLVLTVARLAPEKRIDVLLRAADQAAVGAMVVGAGPERSRLEQLADGLGLQATFTSLPWERILEAYVTADVFALLSDHEPWGVVVNEAAAVGLPLVLSDRVGAARDLLLDGENGVLVGAGDVSATAAAFRRLADDPQLRRSMGTRSRELARGFGYGPSVENLLAAVREATASS